MTPQPGDWAVVDTGGQASAVIRGLEWLSDTVETNAFVKRESRWDHAVMCAQIFIGATPTVMIVEAEPGGARLTEWHYQDRPHQWSSGIIEMTDRQRATASDAALRLAQEHVGYSDLDYLALTLHALHIPAPGLRDFIGGTHRMICSQLVDYCCLQAGVHLYDDGRWPGFVMPSDLGALLCA